SCKHGTTVHEREPPGFIDRAAGAFPPSWCLITHVWVCRLQVPTYSPATDRGYTRGDGRAALRRTAPSRAVAAGAEARDRRSGADVLGGGRARQAGSRARDRLREAVHALGRARLRLEALRSVRARGARARPALASGDSARARPLRGRAGHVLPGHG